MKKQEKARKVPFLGGSWETPAFWPFFDPPKKAASFDPPLPGKSRMLPFWDLEKKSSQKDDRNGLFWPFFAFFRDFFDFFLKQNLFY